MSGTGIALQYIYMCKYSKEHIKKQGSFSAKKALRNKINFACDVVLSHLFPSQDFLNLKMV
jgi:hypothetical protein